MSLLQTVLDSLRSWRRRRAGTRPAKRAGVTVERLDHRQLLTVNFTGNITTDFPAPGGAGVVVLPADTTGTNPDQIAEVPAYLQALVPVSGFAVNAIWVSYDAQSDILSFGLDQPNSGKGTGKDVIAADADDNGNEGNPAWPTPPLPPPVDPAVAALVLQETGFEFHDFVDVAGSEGMYAFLDLNQDGTADVVAGFSNDPLRPNFEIANAINPVPGTVPTFGTPLPQFQGSFFKANDPQNPNFEFQVANFSQLYLQKTGQSLNPNATISIGAFAGSDADDGISSTFLKLKALTITQVTVPTTPCPVSPSPTIWVNPHQHRHINAAHPTDIRVHLLGSSIFDVSQVDVSSVTLAGASPYIEFTHPVNKDQYPDLTFVFNSLDLDPAITSQTGLVDIILSGKLKSGQAFQSATQVFVRGDNSYSAADLAVRDAKRENGNLHALLTPFQQSLFHHGLLEVDSSNAVSAASVGTSSGATATETGVTVKILGKGQRRSFSERRETINTMNNTVRINTRATSVQAASVADTPIVIGRTVRIPQRGVNQTVATSLKVDMSGAN